MMQTRHLIALPFIAILLSACASTYYATMEQLGIHKRDILVDRVEEARDAQMESKDQFKSALDRFSTVLGFEGGDLEEKYEQLNDEYEESESKAEAVRERIAKVEDVAEALFEEWEDELSQYTSQSMQRSSERKLNQTRSEYKKLITAMKRAEAKMDPVLGAFRDQVLFLKHNLNARAISSLKEELVSVRSDISILIKEMENSIGEADAFIKSLSES